MRTYCTPFPADTVGITKRERTSETAGELLREREGIPTVHNMGPLRYTVDTNVQRRGARGVWRGAVSARAWGRACAWEGWAWVTRSHECSTVYVYISIIVSPVASSEMSGWEAGHRQRAQTVE